MDTTHLAQEGLACCLYCGGELAPSASQFGRCFGCGTDWDRVCTNDCPACGLGWVHIHHPDSVIREDGKPIYASGAGWCDCCDTHISYRWHVSRSWDPVRKPAIYLDVTTRRQTLSAYASETIRSR